MKTVICKDPHQHNLDILNQPHICSLCGGDNFLNATSVAESKHRAPSEWVEECIKVINEAMSLRSDIIWKESFNKAIRTALQSVTLPQTQPKQVDLDEVESLVTAYAETEYNDQLKIEAYKNYWRMAIGYTLNDLKK